MAEIADFSRILVSLWTVLVDKAYHNEFWSHSLTAHEKEAGSRCFIFTMSPVLTTFESIVYSVKFDLRGSWLCWMFQVLHLPENDARTMNFRLFLYYAMCI